MLVQAQDENEEIRGRLDSTQEENDKLREELRLLREAANKPNLPAAETPAGEGP